MKTVFIITILIGLSLYSAPGYSEDSKKYDQLSTIDLINSFKNTKKSSTDHSTLGVGMFSNTNPEKKTVINPVNDEASKKKFDAIVENAVNGGSFEFSSTDSDVNTDANTDINTDIKDMDNSNKNK